MMKTPEFWYDAKPGLLAKLLKPLAALYAWARDHHYKKAGLSPLRSSSKVICIGNVTAGGAGKTPVAAALYTILEDMDLLPALVSRGYGGTLEGPVMVDTDYHAAAEVGDEPLMLSQQGLKVWVGKNRRHAVTIVEEMSGLILLDDGYQNPSVHKDMHILVIDGQTGFGNGCLLPAGPLREKPETALARADMVIIIGQDRSGVGKYITGLGVDCPLIKADLVPDPKLMARLKGRHCRAFAGIGRPEKFFSMLRNHDVTITEYQAFADHHPYRKSDLGALLENRGDQKVLTTAKDYVRLPAAIRNNVTPVPVMLQFESPALLKSLVSRKLTV